jgi:hypothetical protein
MLVPGVPSRDVLVRYRGSLSPQLLDVTFTRDEEIDPDSVRAWSIGAVDGVVFGGAGGDLFEPSAGAAAIVHERVEGRRAEVRFEIAGAAPLFLRNMIESLAMSVGPLDSVMVRGALPPEGDRASAETAEVMRWLASGRDYLARWPHVGFPVQEGETGGFALLVRLADAFEEASRQALLQLVFVWRAQVAHYADESGELPQDLASRFERQWPSFGASTRELRACADELAHAPGPSSALLINMLCRFHAIHPIRTCELKI